MIKVKSEATTPEETLTTIYGTLLPVYRICRIIGLNTIRFDNNNRIKSDRTDYIYFAFYLVTFTILGGYSVWCVVTENESSSSFFIVKKYLAIIQNSVMALLIIIVLLFTFIFRKTQIKAFDILSHVDVTFAKSGFSLPYKNLLKNNYIIVSIMAASIVVRSTIMFFTVETDFIQKITLVVVVLVKALSKYQFVAGVLQLQVRFTKINSIISTFYKNSQKDKLLLNPKTMKNIPEQLYILCRLHYKLGSVAQKLNTAFAFQLLFSLAVSLAHLLFQSFYLYYVMAGKADIINVAVIISPVVWLLDEVVEVYWPVYACASTCEQANETATILHELRNSCFDVQLETDIQTYSLQMLHQKVQFSVLGFFVIDYTLIYSILGAVTTYLVIFIQFDQSSNADIVNSNGTSSTNA